jgi:flavin reductase (DIM6/NTAB) family NADH-FMN oxidoreductase RutF
VTIHSENPFLDPIPDQARRFRGRLGGAVTLWTSGAGRERSGLTVSSLMIATGEPASVLGLLDPDSDLAATLSESGRAVVQLLEWRHRELAEMFAGVAPAPGGAFAQAAFTQTQWGPRLSDASTWLGVSLVEARAVGWSRLVTCAINQVEVGEAGDPLVHRRGRYERPAG